MSIQIVDLVKRYENNLVLDHFNLRIAPGEFIGLLGSDGAGKSTLIRCLLGLEDFDKGEITVFDRPLVKNDIERKQKMGFVPQEISILNALTVYENIDYFCSLYIKEKEKRRQLTEQILKELALDDVVKLYPGKLDYHYLRKLNMACGIVQRPEVIIVDEPFNGCESETKECMIHALRKLNEEGSTIIFASKNIEEMGLFCKRICIIDKGKVVVTATVEELKELISVGEKVTIEVFRMDMQDVEEISKMKGVVYANYLGTELVVKSEKRRNNLANILHYLENNHIPFGKVYSETPMLRDVFWEITGREL
ncbi:MAG: ABC transporter ATP-binding protein [Clostridia bacterium]|nr:ABC transporter ATP-binding protein [Clostridia bacterium]